ncbi:alpha/beta hydrolase [Bdellovibrio svalbardensis]|uniref:Alpha/beta fold hydrolase n=1 Tax=Bdellovibrio svalbardensis TaxID=2972972 RepID=A0ABT6DLB0_9BACT|nr:alpha/beta hydrolase [Bdellovibrio svalbardensis]MDG0817603.1 alpha/beta fold hydrolase [Bdellovibrio svalbardensis]
MNSGINLKDFKIPLGKLAPVEKFRTRQGDTLSYRSYPAWSEDLVILYHGAGSDSRYMCALAAAIAGQGIASVITPDFRCHGVSLGNSDKISKNQLEIDLEELLIHIKMQKAVSRITLAGHSMGGGFALRIAVSDLRKQFSKFIALAPHLPLHLNANQPNFGGWISVDSDGSFTVNYPEVMRTGHEKLHYSAEYLRAVHAADDLVEKLQELKPSLTVVTGALDEVVVAEKQREIFAQTSANVLIVENLNHLTIVSKVDNYLNIFA